MQRISIQKMPKVKAENQKHLIRYVNFINSRPVRKLHQKGYETHHIYPRSLAEKYSIKDYNSADNLIELTCREHFIAHMILFKCGYKEMISAFHFMQYDKKHDCCNLTSKQFERLKKTYSEMCSKDRKGKSHKPFTEEQKQHMRKPHGGNAGHNKGHRPSQDQIIKISNTLKGRKLSKECKQHISEGHKGIINSPEAIAKMLKTRRERGIRPSKETLEKLRQSHIGRKASKETKEKMSKAHAGFKHTEETKRKESELLKGKPKPNAVGKVHYTNGIKNIVLHKEDIIPKGYYRGITHFSNSGYKSFKFYNNGVITKKIYDGDEIPKGFIEGRLSFKTKSSGSHWYTNGEKNIKIYKDDSIPEGYRLGRSKFFY